ncbi:uncharacterized protein EI90DRAFT_3036466 [Cantharellus anzutake]|uniref:uncharacterized protein n=1 Tax=Cantharellus anzutake TaxID=1750568 RepID=UPI001907D6FE|nr:uncharacterized protein EI90DRAFT_3036466 [Cantharellus anzutake]KAF8340680.1 hypothetical protein EI90DRAFT_3036466 [Cantharellus anzutake]
MESDLRHAFLSNSIPTIAVDLPSTVLATLSADTNWIHNTENWKNLVNEHPILSGSGGGGNVSGGGSGGSGGGGVGGSLREVVGKKKGEGCKWVVLFGVRDDRPFLVRL